MNPSIIYLLSSLLILYLRHPNFHWEQELVIKMVKMCKVMTKDKGSEGKGVRVLEGGGRRLTKYRSVETCATRRIDLHTRGSRGTA